MALVKYPFGMRDINPDGATTQTGPGWSYEEPNGDLLTIPNDDAGNSVRFNFYFYPGREVTEASAPGVFAIGADITVESVTGSPAHLYWNWNFEEGFSLIAFEPLADSASIVVTGPGVYTNTPTDPYIVSGIVDPDMYDVADRIADTVGFYHGWGDLFSGVPLTGNDIVISHFYPYFLARTGRGRPVRLGPRDDGRGQSSAPRTVPPTKARRVTGGYQ